MSVTGFDRRNGVLHASGVPLPAIAAAVETPAYVYCAETIRARYQRLATALEGTPHRIHFAVKANSSRAVLGMLRELGAGVDIVSGGELFRARAAGFDGRDVVFSGVGKSLQEIAQALDEGVLLINVESEAELLAIGAVAARKGIVAPVGLRVNPEVTVDTPHAYIKTGEKGQKFGIPVEDIARLVAHLRDMPYLALRGMGMHLGSQISNADPLRDALPRLLSAVELARAAGHELRYLDVGGGLSVPYEPSEVEADVDDYAERVRAAGRDSGLTVLLEPGRYIVAESGVLLTRVLYRKLSAGKHFVVTDAGMNDLIRPALYEAYHAIEAVVDVPDRIAADVVGPICESGDFFAKQRTLPDVLTDDLLAIRTAGAYGYTMASNYNSRARPVEVLAENGQFAIITDRERHEDLVRLERAHLQWRTS